MNNEIIPLCEPYLIEDAISDVTECLKSGWVSTAGSTIKEFEEALAEHLSVRHVVCVNSGTSALHLALLAHEEIKDTEIIVPTLTFAASLNPIIYSGAVPLLIDIDPNTLCIDTTLLENFLSTQCEIVEDRLMNKESGRRVSGIIPVHLYGNSCDLDTLVALCAQYKLFMIEDAAESLGATYNKKALGTFSDVGILSFNGNKIITSGHGGAVVTNDDEKAAIARHLSTQAKCDPIRYVHDRVGYNYRMANINASLGLNQMRSLETILEKKHHITEFYKKELLNLPLRFQTTTSKSIHSHWMNTIIFEESVQSWEKVFPIFNENSIFVRPLWHPLHLLKPYQDFQQIGGKQAENVYNYGLCLPSGAGLKINQLRTVSRILHNFFS